MFTGDLVVGPLIEHTGTQRVALIVGQPGQRTVEVGANRLQVVKVGCGGLDALKLKPPADAVLGAAAPVLIDERVAGDRQQPRRGRRPARSTTVVNGNQRSRKRLSHQIRRQLPFTAPRQIGQHERVVTLKERPEGQPRRGE